MKQTDVVIVGGGPAGAVSAMLLARAGYDVVIADRAQFPRAKPCGDCISPQANLLLARLGVLDRIAATQPARLVGWRIVADDGASFQARFEQCTLDPRRQFGFSVAREQFDHILLDAAVEAGAQYRPRLRVEQIIADGDIVGGVRARADDCEVIELKARFTIGADGLRSVMRRRLRLAGRSPRLRKIALTAHVDGGPDTAGFGEMHLQRGLCLGIAPIDAAGQRCNLTLVASTDRYGRAFAGLDRNAIRHCLDQFRSVSGRIAFDPNTVEWRACGPFDWPARGAVARGAALAGDAAGYYDPFTGQGIYHALCAATWLSAAVDRGFREGRSARPLRGYEQRVRLAQRSARVVQQVIERVCARPALARRSIAALHGAPRAAARLVAVTGDLVPAYSLLSPAALLSFLVAFTARSRS